MLYLRIAHYGGFFGAQINNSILLYLILTKAKKLFGSYRHVMCIFTMYALVYSWIEIITQPVMHTKGPNFIAYMNSPLKYEKWIGNNIQCLYCASFGLCISLLASQFFYRYIAVCRQDKLKLISGIYVISLFIPPVICFVVWFLFVYYGMDNTVEKQEYFEDVLRIFYDEDSSKVAFIAPLYWTVDENGEKHWRIMDLMSSIGCTFIIIGCFSVILVCAIETYYKMKDTRTTMSHRTRELNRQLFVTLTLQTALPLCMMYSPVCITITFPMLGVDLGRLANLNSACLGVYPSLEPLIAMFFIRDFRNTVLFRKKKVVVFNTRPLTTSRGNNSKHFQNSSF